MSAPEYSRPPRSLSLPLPHPLPRRITPYPDETLGSYLQRLAAANRLDAQALRNYLANDHRKTVPVPLNRLAALSGLPTHTLCHAIPDLCSQENLSRGVITDRLLAATSTAMACRFCTLAHGHQEAVWCWRHHEIVVCFRHRRWIGPGTLAFRAPQPDLTHQPDILQAAKRHRRLLRRYGRESLDRAYLEAGNICHQWIDNYNHDKEFERRMDVFHGMDWKIDRNDPTFYAAAYPEVIALTRLLASPYWRSLAFENLPYPHRFVEEVCHTVAPNYQWSPDTHYRRYEPLAMWINEQLMRKGGPSLLDYRIAEYLQRSSVLDDRTFRT